LRADERESARRERLGARFFLPLEQAEQRGDGGVADRGHRLACLVMVLRHEQ
jgi:hypothetical protein